MSIYKAYDIRGKVPQDLSPELTMAIGRALVSLYRPEMVVVGRDARLSGDLLFEALTAGLMSQGADVVNIGQVSSPMFYFAAGRGEFPLGVMITASHNPAEYNGFKLVRQGSRPIGGEEIQAIRERVEAGMPRAAVRAGTTGALDILRDYRDHIQRFSEGIKPRKVVMDAGNSIQGALIPHLYRDLPLEIVPLFFELDGGFPNHPPDPIRPENVAAARETLLREGADLACVFDGDADRVIFIDENGQVLPGDMTTLIMALDFLEEGQKGPFLTDCRSSRIVEETMAARGARTIKIRVGHSFIKKRMREENAVFGGELSGHYYFKANYFTECTELGVFRILRMMSRSGKTLSELVAPHRSYSQSGEINTPVADQAAVAAVMAGLEAEYQALGGRVEELDGLTVDFPDWWFNLRPSNTEPLLRLNVEARRADLMAEKRDELIEKIRAGQ